MEYIDLSRDEALNMPSFAVLAYSVASLGANGNPGEVKVIQKDGKIFRFNFANFGLNGWMPTGDTEWVSKYMGLGNILFVRPEDESWLEARLDAFKDEPFFPNVPLYKNWVKFYLEKISLESDLQTRVVVCGGRDFKDYELLKRTLDKALPMYRNIEIVSGHARGADSLGERYAKEKGIPCVIFPADWKGNGRRAGFIRNSQMIEYAKLQKPLVIAFWDGESHGTKDTLDKAKAANIECIIITYKKDEISNI